MKMSKYKKGLKYSQTALQSHPAKLGGCQVGFSLIRKTSAEQYMFEKDHIYILSRVFSADLTMPNWPCGSVEEARSLVVHTVEPSFLAGGPQVERKAAMLL